MSYFFQHQGIATSLYKYLEVYAKEKGAKKLTSEVSITAVLGLLAKPTIDILVEVSEFEHNRDGYTNAKTEFVQKIMNLAKPERKS